jgi:hypothetical protein
MYKAILLPKLLYAAIVWWPMVRKVETRNLLRSLQGNYLRAVVGAMKTTPTEALEVALYQAPLDLVAIETAELTAYRLKCQGEWRNAGSGHIKLAFLQKYPYTLNRDRILKKYQLVKSYKIRIPTRQDWQSQKQSMTTVWTIGTQMGQEYRTALGQVYMDPHMNIGKVYLWEAFPRYFLQK